MGDFAENHTFVIQDEVQGYHWHKDGCTLHPVVIYSKNNDGEVIAHSLCVISDDKKHDYFFVYKVLESICEYVKENIPNITKIHYFSDGCPNQYKNKYYFMNITYHLSDFSIECEWAFFATCHGKSPLSVENALTIIYYVRIINGQNWSE